MSWYNELVEKAEQNRQNAPKTIEELRTTRAQIYADTHAQEVQAMLDGVGRGLELRKQKELERKQFEESEKAKEQARLEDIAKNGSNDNNNKSIRDAYRNLFKTLPKSANRTEQILN